MINSIEIQNFKSVGELQRIPFAPLTLLLGPNSAGKSSVMDALAAFSATMRYPSEGSTVTVGDEERHVDLKRLRRVGSQGPTILRVTSHVKGPWVNVEDHPHGVPGEHRRAAGRWQDWPTWGRDYGLQDHLLEDGGFAPDLSLVDEIRTGVRIADRPDDGSTTVAGIAGWDSGGQVRELSVGGRMLLVTSDPGMDGNDTPPNREECDPWLRPQTVSELPDICVVVLDLSHPLVFEGLRQYFCDEDAPDLARDAAKVEEFLDELRSEATIGELPPVTFFGLPSTIRREFDGSDENLVVLLYHRALCRVWNLADLDWKGMGVPEDDFNRLLRWISSAEEERDYSNEPDWAAVQDAFLQGPRKWLRETTGPLRWKEARPGVDAMNHLIGAWLRTMWHHAGYVRQELECAAVVPAVRSAISSTKTLEAQTSKEKGPGRLAATLSRDSLERASSWMAKSDRLDLGVEVQLEDFFEFDPSDAGMAKVLRRGGSGKEVSEALRKAGALKTLVRFRDMTTGALLSATDLGEGVSQVLPVVAAVLSPGYHGFKPHFRLCLMQQPELHLHPRIEARLGDLLMYGVKWSRLRAATRWKSRPRTFLVETHSEHLVLRLARRIREAGRGKMEAAIAEMMDELAGLGRAMREGMTEKRWVKDEEILEIDRAIEQELQAWIKPDDVAVIYAEPTPEGTVYHHLRIDEDGEFMDPWPDGFFPERAEELRP